MFEIMKSAISSREKPTKAMRIKSKIPIAAKSTVKKKII